MKFTDTSLTFLDAYFVKHEVRLEYVTKVQDRHWDVNRLAPYTEDEFERVQRSVTHHAHVATLGDAQGITMQCPRCRDHRITLFFSNHDVPPQALPKLRWGVSGLSLSDLSLTPSIHLTTAPCRVHFTVQKGFCADAT